MISLEAAVIAFQGAVEGSYWEEHGISDEEAAEGLRAAFKALGIEYEDDCLFLHGQLSDAERIEESWLASEAYAENQRKWREDNPEQAATQDLIERQLRVTQEALSQRIIDDIFKPNPVWNLLRGKA